MRLLDRLSPNKTLLLIVGFIVSILKIFIPWTQKELEKSNPIPPLPAPPMKKRGRPPKKGKK